MTSWPWLAAFAVILACVWLARRRHRLRKHYVQERSAAHEAYLAALTDWITNPEILKVAYQTGTLSKEGLERLKHQLVGAREEPEVRALLAAFLQHRKVRQAVAKHMAKEYGSDKGEVLKHLMSVADVGRAS